MKRSKCEDLVKRMFGNRVPDSVYTAMADLDKAENDLTEAIENKSVQPHHYSKLDEEKAHMFDILTNDGMIVIGYIKNRYEE